MSDQPKIVIDEPKQNGAPVPFHPEIHIAINEIEKDGVKQWFMEVRCAVQHGSEKGFMMHSFIAKSLEDTAKNIPEILKHVKEKFYA